MSEYLNLTELKKKGWTKGEIDKFLGAPDATKTNPMYRSAAPVKLYCRKRVAKIESSKKFKDQRLKNKSKREKLKEATKKRMDDKRLDLIVWIELLDINVPRMSEESLYKKACFHYNNMWSDRGEYDKFASPKSDKQFLNRISVNYLRHCCTKYEETLESMFGKIGNKEGYKLLKVRTLEAIGVMYPYLRDECVRQEEEMRKAEEYRSSYYR